MAEKLGRARTGISWRADVPLISFLFIAFLLLIFSSGGSLSALAGSDSWSGAPSVCTSPQISTSNTCSFVAEVPVGNTLESGENWNNTTWYKFVPASTATIYIRATSSTDNTLHLRDSSGSILTRNDDSYGLDAAISYPLVTGTTYFVGVGSYSDVGIPAVTVQLTMSRPDPPTSVNATASGVAGTVTVSWTSSDISTRSVTSFTVRAYSGATEVATQSVGGTPPSTSYSFTGLTNGTAYTFRVSATNSVGTSDLSVASASAIPYSVQTVSFGTLSARVYGSDPFVVTATSNAPGATIEFSTSTPTICAINSSTVTILSTGTCSITATGLALSGWSSGSTTRSFTVSAKALTVSGLTVTTREYDGSQTMSIIGVGSLIGVVPADSANISLVGTPTGTADAKNVGMRTVTVGGLSLSGSVASRYSLPTVTISGQITPKALTINGTTLTSRSYNGSSAISATPGSTSGFVGTETLVVTASGVLDSPNAGSRTATVNYALANGTNGGIATNYSLSPSLVATTITPKQLTVTGSVATSRQYDGTRNVEVAVGTVTGYVGSETLLISATGVTDSADVGTRTASVTYALANGANGGIGENYSLLSQSISSVISKKTLTVTNTSVATRQYDGTPSMNPTVGTVTGYVGSESLAVTATAVVESSNAGSRTATVTYTLANGENSGLASNYSLAPGSVATTIERRELSISGSTVASRAYNGSTTVTALPGTITGLVGSENLVVTATGVLNSPNAGTRIATVTYTLLNGANGGIGSNYVLDADEIQTTIAKKTLTAVGTTAVGRVYDGTSDISIVVGTISGLVGTETLSVGASGTSISANVGTHTTSVNFQVTDGLNGGVAANYLLASTTIQATISRKSLIVNGTTVSSRQYNGSRVIVAEAGTLTGLVGTESLTLSASGLLDTANAGNRTALIVYTLGDGENGGIATNYEAISDSLAVTIAPKELSVLGTTASNRQYNGSATVGVTVGSISGLVGNETLAITASGVADSANAGQRNVIISYQLSNGSNGGLASNYVLSSSTAQVAIARRILLVSGSVVANKTYNGTSNATVSLGTVSNFVAAERPLITASASFHDVVPGTQSATVTYVVADDSATSALGTNYEVAAQTLSAEISKATISFTVSARDRVYNGTTRASLVIGSPVGVVAGDEVEIDSDKIEGSFNDAEPGLNRLVNLTISSGLLVGADAGNYLYQAPSNPRADITKANQSGFEFTSPTSFFADSSLTLQASGGQTANEITYSVVSGVCQVSGSRLTASRGGSSCAVSATRPGDSRYNSAATSITIRVDKVLQNLVFRSQAPVSPVVGSRYTVDVDSDVALAPTIAIANSSTTVCSISAGVVTFNAIGNCLISASQSGNDVYAAAAASQSITVVAAPVATTVPPAPAGQGATTNTSSTTIPQTAVPAPASTTATTSTTTTTTTTTIPADPGRPYLVDGKSPSLEVGEATAIVRGQVVNVITTTENGQLTMTLPGRVIVKIGTTNSASGEAQVGSDGKLRMYGDTEVSVEVSGFVPDSTYTVFMFSEPLELGRGETGADGSVRDSLLVPSDVEAGEHTLQMNGVGPGDEVVSISMGFEVMERQSNTRIAVIVIMFAIALALLGGRPIFARRRVRA